MFMYPLWSVLGIAIATVGGTCGVVAFFARHAAEPTDLRMHWLATRLEAMCSAALFANGCLLVLIGNPLGVVLMAIEAWPLAKRIRAISIVRRARSRLRALVADEPHVWLTWDQNALLRL